MSKIMSLDDLKRIKEEVRSKSKLREKGLVPENIVHIKIGMATCGIASGAKEIMHYFLDETNQQAIDAVITQTGCLGYCYAEPTVEVTLPGREPVIFGYVDKKKAQEIIDQYINKGELIDGIIPVGFKTIDE